MLPQPSEKSKGITAGLASHLAVDTLTYGLIAQAPKIISISILPIVYRTLTPDRYGLIEYTFTLLVWTSTLGAFGIDSAFARLMFDSDDPADLRNLFSQSIALLLLTTTSLLLILFAFKYPILTGLGIESSTYAIILFTVPFYVLSSFVLVALRWIRKRKRYGIYSLLQATCQPLVLLALSLNNTLSTEIAFKIYLALNVALSGLGLLFCRAYLCIPQSMNRYKGIMQYAIPIGLFSSISSLTPVLERYLIYDYAGTDLLGQYIATTKIAGIVLCITSAFHMALGPLVFRAIGVRPAPNLYSKIFSIHAFLAIIFGIGIYLAAVTVLPFFLGTSYTLPGIFLLFLITAHLVNSGSSIVELGIHISKKTSAFLIVLLSGLSVFLGTFYLLKNSLLASAMPCAVLASSLATLYATILLSTKVSKIDWKTRRPMLLSACYFIIFGFLGSKASTLSDYLLTLSTFVFAVPLTWRLYLNYEEKKMILSIPSAIVRSCSRKLRL